MNAQPCDEFCPRCGKWVTQLHDLGWCHECTLETGRCCTRCQQMLPLSHYARDRAREASGGRRPVCRACDTKRRRLREQAKRREGTSLA